MAITKAQEIYEEIEKRIASGIDKADAFKALAEETGRPFDSLRGSYYTWKRKLEGGEPNAKPARTRRRETTPDDALADARAALERPWRRSTERSRSPKPGPTRPRRSTRRSKEAQRSARRPSHSVWTR